MDNQTIQLFLDAHDYDIRKTHNGRWIDQKCTMDVVCIVSDCIMEYTRHQANKGFTVKDIWYSEYTVEYVQQIFSKPDPAKEASNEYDKYFGQPIKLLEAAGIICGEREGRGYRYHIVNRGLLEYISFRERDCYNFLCLYIEKVLKDSGIYHLFEQFFAAQDKDSFKALRDGYFSFIIDNTPINGTTECGRIFSKVLNPLACKKRKRGTEKGRISKDVITQDMLMYNQRNWRDVLSDKPKGRTRVGHEETLPEHDESYMTAYRINRAKHRLRRFNDQYRKGRTEVSDERHNADSATQMHHIFPVSEYPEISAFLENLIALTPTQHFSYAHPNNNTQYIDKKYQYQCLLAKTESIRDNLTGKNNEKVIYDFCQYQIVLSMGLGEEEFMKVGNMDFEGVLNKLAEYFAVHVKEDEM